MARRFHRARHHAGRAAAGWKGSLMSVGAGAATGFASNYAISAVPFLGQAWWTMPAAMAVVGHFLRRKYPAIGGAMLGIAGYWALNTYQQQKAAPAATAKGLDTYDAAALVQMNETRATSAAPALEAGALMSASGFIDAADISDAMGLDGG